jgi:hypothetical protein
VARTDQDQMVLADQLEWVLPHYEAATTQVESLNDEVNRLQVLKSYMILDNPREEAFERITALVRSLRAFLTLSDFHSWSNSAKTGLQDFRCAHWHNHTH